MSHRSHMHLLSTKAEEQAKEKQPVELEVTGQEGINSDIEGEDEMVMEGTPSEDEEHDAEGDVSLEDQRPSKRSRMEEEQT
jgi:hypothetical protein